MDNTLLNLPWQIQLALGSGYLAYLVAYSGIRQHHTATDTVFRSFSFGLTGTAIILWVPLRHVWLEGVAVLATLATGAFWRWKGMLWAKSLLKQTNVSWSDDIPTAWISITAIRTDVRPSQIAVDLTDGRLLLCKDTRDFEDFPYGPCTFGLDGSIAFYVTEEMRDDGKWIEKLDIKDEVDGPRLTYVPAAAIKRVEIRLWTKSNEKALSAEALAAGEAAAEEEP